MPRTNIQTLLKNKVCANQHIFFKLKKIKRMHTCLLRNSNVLLKQLINLINTRNSENIA